MDDRFQITQTFEKKLSRTLQWAFLAGVLHRAATWLGGGTITWATVVLMGGFASALPIPDFTIITLLVLLIFILLALAHFTCKLVTKKSLSTGSLQPLKIVYQDERLAKVNLIKFISILVQCVALAFIFWISTSNIQRSRPDLGSLSRNVFSKPHHVDSAAGLAYLQACLQSCATNHGLTTAFALQTCAQFCFPAQFDANSTYTATTNLQVCLFTFHFLVIVTCSLVSLCNIYILCRVAEACWLMYSGGPITMSLTRYHDEVLRRILNHGLVQADEFERTEFLVRGVGEDLAMRNIGPLEVKRQNKDFIKYLFYHQKGVEMVMGMLASEDTLLQQTAANMPGFWSSEHEGMKKNGMELLSKLGEKLGLPGKVAEGAANSFKSLAVAWKGEDHSPLLKVYVSRSGGRQQRTSAGKSSHMPVLASGEVAPVSLAPVRSSAGGGESTNAVSRSEGEMEGGDESTNAISTSGGGGECAGSGSGGAESSNAPSSTGGVEKKESMQRSSKSEVAEGGGSGISESSQTVARPEGGEGHGHSQSGGEGAGCKSGDVVCIPDDPGGGAGEPISTSPESSDHTTSIPQGEGQREAAAGDQSVLASGGGCSSHASGQGRGRDEASTGLQVASARGDGDEDEQKWNVVRKVVDLVAHKRVPTLQVYVRALDAFFMSKSIMNSLTDEEKMAIKSKLLKIVEGRSRDGGGSNQATAEQGGGSGRRYQGSRANTPVNQVNGKATADHVSIRVDASMAIKARTRLLAFSALVRLGLDPGIDGSKLLRQLDQHLLNVPEASVIWFEEKDRYEELCGIYSREPGEWFTSNKWTTRGLHSVAL